MLYKEKKAEKARKKKEAEEAAKKKNRWGSIKKKPVAATATTPVATNLS
jgi:hypothetical protein